jgi:hypothetical protein
MRAGSANGNWKGGISSIRKADDILSLPLPIQAEIKRRILAKIEASKTTTCWNWVGKIFNSNGRARLSLGRNAHIAARIAFVIYKGPTNSLNVLHTCDNILCVNPDHLWLGTSADNSADMVKKGRQAKGNRNGSRLHPERLVRGVNHINHINPERVQGENNGRALLTESQVREIRRKYRPYINNHKPSNQKELAKEFNVGVWVIKGIVHGETWRSVK